VAPSCRSDAGVSFPHRRSLVLAVAVLLLFLALLASADLFPQLLGADSTGLVAPLR
jgi:hypothetical protein